MRSGLPVLARSYHLAEELLTLQKQRGLAMPCVCSTGAAAEIPKASQRKVAGQNLTWAASRSGGGVELLSRKMNQVLVLRALRRAGAGGQYLLQRGASLRGVRSFRKQHAPTENVLCQQNYLQNWMAGPWVILGSQRQYNWRLVRLLVVTLSSLEYFQGIPRGCV